MWHFIVIVFWILVGLWVLGLILDSFDDTISFGKTTDLEDSDKDNHWPY